MTATDDQILADRVETIRQTVSADKGAGSPVRMILLALGALIATGFGVYSISGGDGPVETQQAALIPEEVKTTERARPAGGIFGDIRPRVGRNTENEIDVMKADLARLKDIIDSANEGEAVDGNVLIQLESLKKTVEEQQATIADLEQRLSAAEERAKMVPAVVATGPDDADRLGGDILIFNEGQAREEDEAQRRFENQFGGTIPDRGEVIFTPLPGEPAAE